MISVKREPSTQLHPASTKLHIRVSVETTSLNTEVRNARNTELQRLANSKVHIPPFGVRIAAPMACEVAASGKGRSTDEEGTLVIVCCEQSVVSCIGREMAVEIMQSVLCAVVGAVVVRGIRGDSLLH